MFQGSFGECLSLLIPFFSAGIYLAVIVADAVFSDQYKTGTLKNEVSYGRPVYASTWASCSPPPLRGCCWCFSPCWPTPCCAGCSSPPGRRTGRPIQTFLFRLLAAVPLWLGALALTMAVMFNLPIPSP